MRRAKSSRWAEAAPAGRRRSASGPTVRGRRRDGERKARQRSCCYLRPQRRKAGADIVAARVPETASLRHRKPLGDGGGGLRIFTQQKVAYCTVGHIGVVNKIEQFASDGVGGFGE